MRIPLLIRSSYRIRYYSVVLFFILKGLVLSAQSTQIISGKVFDENNNGLPGVNILVKGTATGTTTDADGAFGISGLNSSSVLIFSFIGYQNQEISIGNKNTLMVTMASDVAVLKEVLVVGYGSQSREVLTTSISKLDTKVLENVPYTNAASALQGTISGVRVQSISGQPGAAPRVIVRGGTSINNPNGASPLYIIDGIIRTDMNDINSEDIESMQVLKDVAATSIYGARGSNGVVIITTKSGKIGQTRITYSYDLTSSKPGKLFKMANARVYLTINR